MNTKLKLNNMEKNEVIERYYKIRKQLWDIVGECMTGNCSDRGKLLRIEKLLLDTEDYPLV
jgi:hypothetical protein